MPGPIREESQTKKTQTTVVTIIVLIVLFGLGTFAWRVAYFANLIRKGEIVQEDLRFVANRSQAQALPIPTSSLNGTQTVSADDPRLGSATAPITIVEFADFACPFSREASRTMRVLAAKYPEKINYIYRDFPITDLNGAAAQAAAAGECAHAQGKFWEYHDKLYLNQDDLSEARLISYAREANLNTEQFTRCLKGDQFAEEVQTDLEDGVRAGVTGTPTFFINGLMVPGAIPEAILEEIINNWTGK
jgi:protein-disulfide isomerase